MATEIINGPLGEVRAASTAGGGTALTTTAQRIQLPLGSKQLDLLPRNFVTAVVVKWNKNPWLTVLKTTDALATAGNLTDYSQAAQDGAVGSVVTLSSLDTAANLDYLYFGSHLPFSGVAVTMTANVNVNASVLTVNYWNGTAWASITPTDGSASGGATFGQTGNVTWTVPTDWQSARLVKGSGATYIGDTGVDIIGIGSQELFWTRWQVSAALDASTTASAMLSINRDATYAELPSGATWEESVTVGPGGISSITALTDAGTANLIVNVAARGRFNS